MKKLVLLDMDGTIYLGDKLFDCVPKVFKFFKENNIEFVFLTNNSSKSISEYVKKIRKMGIECDAHNFYTSIETTIRYLEDKKFKNLYVLGVKTFKKELSKKFKLLSKYATDKKVDAVISSFDVELTYNQLKDASLFIQDGSDFLATNIDARCPIENDKYIPDCGGISKCIEMCTNIAPKFLGKPSPTMVNQIIEKYGFKKEDVILVGDRYYTDIMAGINAGIDTLAVLSGETKKKEFENAKIKPTYIKKDIGSIIDILKRKENRS